MTKQDFLDIGFKELPHLTITNSLTYDLGRRRLLSADCVGTPNEMIWICETQLLDNKQINDLICLHNYDFDGYITRKKMLSIINGIGKAEKNIKHDE